MNSSNMLCWTNLLSTYKKPIKYQDERVLAWALRNWTSICVPIDQSRPKSLLREYWQEPFLYELDIGTNLKQTSMRLFQLHISMEEATINQLNTICSAGQTGTNLQTPQTVDSNWRPKTAKHLILVKRLASLVRPKRPNRSGSSQLHI